jgi:murein DD-endopeptidase MepM/ murein hydrolase activator NlpD
VRKRYYILFVARGSEGELRKIPIPLHYLYVFLAGALIGMMTITGMAGSYTRMLMKVMNYNELRTEREALRQRYSTLEKVAREKEIQAASLSSLADEVSSLYGLKSESLLTRSAANDSVQQDSASVERLYALKTSAMSGATTLGISFGPQRNASMSDWLRLASSPAIWPVEGTVTGSFGERIDPFNGEGAFHSGIDISTSYGHAVIAPADGVVTFADVHTGYGRLVILEHAHDISTRYGHLGGFAVAPGQLVHRGDVIGYVGLTGRSTGPHLHYEVRIHDVPVNPYHYLRTTVARLRPSSNTTD